MRCLAKLATLVLMLTFGCTIAFDKTADAQTILESATQLATDSPATDNVGSTEEQNNFVSEIISAAEKSGTTVIIIDGSPPQNKPAAPESAASDALSTQNSKSSYMTVQSNALEFRKKLKARLAQLPESIEKTHRALILKSPTDDLHPFLRALYWSVLLLLFGALVERELYVKRIVERWLEPRLKENPVGYYEKVPILIKRALLKIIGLVFSMMVAFFTGTMMFKGTPPESIQFTIAALYIAYAACRLLSIIWRLILAPYLCQYRIPHFSNKDARKLFHWLWVISLINIVVLVFSIWVGELAGRSHIHAAMVSIFSAFIALANTLMVIANRKAISTAIRNGKTTAEVGMFPRLVSQIWLAFTIGYFTFSWLEVTYRVVLSKPLSIPLIAGAYAILISIICIYALINFFIERFFQREKRYVTLSPEPDPEPDNQSDLASDTPEIQDDLSITTVDDSISDTVLVRHPLTTYEDLARRVAGILAVLAGMWALTKIWNIDSSMMSWNEAQRGFDAVVILFIGYIVYHIVRIWIDNKIQEEGGDTALAPGDEGGATGASRLATLLPLFRNFMLLVISMSVIFSALLEMGINVSPLFASAGVVGLAIGFGAQTLVRDIFSGAFYLFDDAFRRGEYVDIGSVKGTVEKISVRSFQLRHHLGPLHTIPFGEIQSLTNFSRDWVMMKLKLRLTYDTDPERVRKLVKKLGQELMQDPIIGDTFLQPLKSQGVIEMQDSAMIVRVKFMSKPGDQWVIRKRVYQEIRDLFQREGIHFAHKEVTVRVAGDVPENLTKQQTHAIAAAALDDQEDEHNSSGNGDDR